MRVNSSEVVRMISGLVHKGLLPEFMWTHARERCIEAVKEVFEPFIAVDISDVGTAQRFLRGMKPTDRLAVFGGFCQRCGEQKKETFCGCGKDDREDKEDKEEESSDH